MSCTLGSMQNHGSLRLPCHTFLLLIVALALYAFGGPAPEVLVFDRQAIMHGELWRLFTGHWVHGDLEHLVWNLAAFVILGWMIETSICPSRLYIALLAGMCIVDICVWWFIPTLGLYCGLSGILNTLLFLVLIDGWLKSQNIVFPLVMVAAIAKIVFEMVTSSAIFTHTTWPSVPEAHLAGALAAVLVVYYRGILTRGIYVWQRLQHNGTSRTERPRHSSALNTTRINPSNELI
jgi:rhomboid family GlyGly-CTERM serine protease